MPENNSDHDILIALRSEVQLGFGSMKEEIKDIKTNTTYIVNDHETRLRAVEQSNWKIYGFAAGISFFVSAAGTLAAFLVIN